MDLSAFFHCALQCRKTAFAKRVIVFLCTQDFVQRFPLDNVATMELHEEENDA